jgi:hypothetical protein
MIALVLTEFGFVSLFFIGLAALVTIQTAAASSPHERSEMGDARVPDVAALIRATLAR